MTHQKIPPPPACISFFMSLRTIFKSSKKLRRMYSISKKFIIELFFLREGTALACSSSVRVLTGVGYLGVYNLVFWEKKIQLPVLLLPPPQLQLKPFCPAISHRPFVIWKIRDTALKLCKWMRKWYKMKMCESHILISGKIM